MIKDISSLLQDPEIDLTAPPQMLELLETALRPIYILFVASKDPATGQPWCPDVRAALPVIYKVFEEEEDEEYLCAIVEVGLKEEWKRPYSENKIKQGWNITNIPTLSRYELVDIGGDYVYQVKSLVENECIDVEKLVMLRDAEMKEIPGLVERLKEKILQDLEPSEKSRRETYFNKVGLGSSSEE